LEHLKVADDIIVPGLWRETQRPALGIKVDNEIRAYDVSPSLALAPSVADGASSLAGSPRVSRRPSCRS
jgi:hypothetical protein